MALFGIMGAAFFRIFGLIDGLVNGVALLLIGGVTFLFIDGLVDGLVGGLVAGVALLMTIPTMMVVVTSVGLIFSGNLNHEASSQEGESGQPTLRTHAGWISYPSLQND